MPNSFWRLDLLALSRIPWAPCLGWNCVRTGVCIEGEQVGLERGRSLLVSDKDLEAVDHVGQGDGAVVAPLVHNVVIVDKDDEVIR